MPWRQALVSASQNLEGVFATQIGYDGDNPEYIGEAQPGAATSDATWRIRKITYSGSNPTAIQWAGKGEFNQIWDNRASLTYS